MTACPRATGERVREAAAEIRACDTVLAVDVLDPNESPRGCWTIEITMSEPQPPAVSDRLASHDLSVPSTAPQGDGYRTVATA